MFGVSSFNDAYFFPNRGQAEASDTLLSKSWQAVGIVSITVFVGAILGLQYAFESAFFDKFKDEPSRCVAAVVSPQWIQIARWVICGCSGSALLSQIVRTVLAVIKNPHAINTISAYIAAMVVMLINFSGEVLHISGLFSGVCEDSFGVRSPLIEMAEWQVTVPLMVFLSLTLDTKKKSLTFQDWSILCCSYLSIVFGLVVPPMVSFKIAVVSISMSCLTMFFVLVSIFVLSVRAHAEFCRSDVDATSISQYLGFLVARKRLNSCIWIVLIFPLFPVVYFSRVCTIIDHDQTTFAFAVLNFVSKSLFIVILMEGHLDFVDRGIQESLAGKKAKAALERERKLNVMLLRQMLPMRVVDELRAGRTVVPFEHSAVTIFFSDVVGFTDISSCVPPMRVMEMLNELYTVMDYCASLFPTYKVETIGDAYMLAAGIFIDPEKDVDHVTHIANFALLVRSAVSAVKNPVTNEPLRIRMGIHSGPVISGVVGSMMPRYCLFGDTVNSASRMESNGEASRIHLSEVTAKMLKGRGEHNVELRGEIPIKGKGMMTTYWLESAVEANTLANAEAVEKTTMTCRSLLAVKSLTKGAGGPTGEEAPEPTGPTLPAEPPSKMRILLVENSEKSRKKLVAKLSSINSGFDITVAEHAEQAIEKLKVSKNCFDLVLVTENLSIDGLLGHELVDFIRESLKMRHCVVIGNNVKRLEQKYRDVGADDVWEQADAKDALSLFESIKLSWSSRRDVASAGRKTLE
jgi:class 3 adenylate cyclase